MFYFSLCELHFFTISTFVVHFVQNKYIPKFWLFFFRQYILHLLIYKLVFSYFQPGWIVQLVRFQLGWFFDLGENQLSWKLSNEILVLLHCFTKSFLIGYHFLTKPITTLTWSQQPIRMIQLGWKPFRIRWEVS